MKHASRPVALFVLLLVFAAGVALAGPDAARTATLPAVAAAEPGAQAPAAWDPAILTPSPQPAMTTEQEDPLPFDLNPGYCPRCTNAGCHAECGGMCIQVALGCYECSC
jgi:hypothetical protein